MASVALRSVTKVYPGGVRALDSLGVAVRDRELLVLLGPSGCGKSTTLRLIAGLEKPTEGEILIGGCVVNGVSPKDRNIAMVFQNAALYPHMSVYKNMAFGLQLRCGGGWPARVWRRLTRPGEAVARAEQRRGIRPRVEDTARLLGIEHLLTRAPRQLSGGERQRVALGRAMVRQPAVFLLDEPLSNLDAQLRLETRRELKRIHGRLRATMIYVTHDQTEALTLGDRVAVLKGGRLQQLGTPQQIYDTPSNLFVAGFVGSPPMNLCAGRWEKSSRGWEFVAEAIRVGLTEAAAEIAGPQRNREVVMGIRPADIRLREANDPAPGHCQGVVTLVESLGDTTFVYVQLAGRPANPKNSESEGKTGPELACQVAPRSHLRAGDRVEWIFDTQRIHWFHAESGDNCLHVHRPEALSADW